ncbi:Sodium/calcium exchanger membrane region [Penicillium camemberti]|uniref:Sodium/calcium exchanger membrane region n=1 Tax=Penicillium camemberti (strain FM 013) TaxID=1429867 RepID=A0A0G4PFG8_PENC3|nr:Sodium/calcium exchanger membrane region [Penicillium camemberti]
MMTTVNGSNDKNLHDISTFAGSSTSDEHAALNTSFESDPRSSGSYPCQYEMSRQAELASTNSGSDDIFHKVKNFLRPDKTQLPNDDGSSVWPHHGRPCNSISIFKQQTKQIVSPRIIFSGAFAASAVIISNTQSPALVIFIWNLLAIVPLSITLTEATERISKDLGETAGALLNITIGNLAELIIFTALMKNNIKVVQSSLLGSILVNLLLVLGSAIIAGCISTSDVTYNTDLTQSFVGLLNLTISCLMIPSAFYGSVKSVTSADHMSLSFSRGVSIILLGTYFLYLFFQFKSHAHLFHSTRLQVPHPTDPQQYTDDLESHPTQVGSATSRDIRQLEMQEVRSRSCSVDAHTAAAMPLFHNEPSELRTSLHRQAEPAIGDYGACSCERYVVKSNRAISVTLLALSTILIAICAEYFSSSFSTLNEQGVLGESFVGLIVIPIAGNVAENVTAVVVASKNQMDLAISVALGSAIQIGLLVSPAMVLIGWALDKPMTLHFDRFEMVTLIGAVLLVDFIVLKGKTNYLEGAILCACFAAISVGAYLLPLT